MKTFVLCLLTLTLAAAGLLAQGQSQGKGKSKAAGQGQTASAPVATLDIRFSSADARAIVDYYRPRLQQLPPGLEKKVQRGGTLPPGWQKKVQVFPQELVGRLPPAPAGCTRVVSGKVALLIQDATNVVLDIIDLVR
jgi:hypothetical protein